MALEELKREFMQKLAAEVFNGILLDVTELPKLPVADGRDYIRRAKDILHDHVFRNELNRLKNELGTKLMRHSSTLEDIAWCRGSLHALEALDSRLQLLAQMPIPQEVPVAAGRKPTKR